MSPLFHSRRRATAITVPSALALIVVGAFVAAPALAASPAASPTLPFPTVCPSGETAGATPSTSPSTSATPTTSASGTPSPTSSATPKAVVNKKASPAPSASATPTTTASGSTGGSAGTSPSPSPSPSSSSSSSGGFWGWLNGVWTWILSDAPYTESTGAVAADAPLTGDANANAVAANAPLGDRGGVVAEDAADADPSQSASPSPSCVPGPTSTDPSGSEGVYAATTPWVMKTPSMTLTGLTFNGVKTVKVYSASAGGYVDEKVLDFTASELTIQSMVTYSIQPGTSPGSENTVYNNAGSGTTTTLKNVHMMTVSLSASLYGLIPQDYTPTSLPPLPEGLDLGFIPVIFTDATVQLAFLNTGSIDVPGFAGAATPGAASPE